MVKPNRIFSELALEKGYNVIGSETHGMAQRGDSVISHLRIGDYSSPFVRKGTADILLSFDRDAAYRTLGFVKRGGLCLVNSPKEDFWDPGIKGYLEKNEIRAYSFPADKVALALGAPQSANLTLIGYALSVPDVPFTYEDVKETIVRISPPRFRDVNLQAFDTGYRGEKSIPPKACPEQGRRVGGDRGGIMKWEEYLVPTSLEEALAVLKEHQGRARVFAGGTDLIIQLKNKEVTARCLVDVTNLDELKGIELEDGFIRIGTCVTHQELVSSSLIRERAAALAEGASQVGSPQIRHMGTVGGNIVNAQPPADTVVPLMALEVEVATATGTRRKPLGGLCVGPGQCTVDATTEILTSVRFRALGPNQGSAFARLAKRKALSLPILNTAVVVTLNDGSNTFQEVRLAVGPVAPVLFDSLESAG